MSMSGSEEQVKVAMKLPEGIERLRQEIKDKTYCGYNNPQASYSQSVGDRLFMMLLDQKTSVEDAKIIANDVVDEYNSVSQVEEQLKLGKTIKDIEHNAEMARARAVFRTEARNQQWMFAWIVLFYGLSTLFFVLEHLSQIALNNIVTDDATNGLPYQVNKLIALGYDSIDPEYCTAEANAGIDIGHCDARVNAIGDVYAKYWLGATFLMLAVFSSVVLAQKIFVYAEFFPAEILNHYRYPRYINQLASASCAPFKNIFKRNTDDYEKVVALSDDYEAVDEEKGCLKQSLNPDKQSKVLDYRVTEALINDLNKTTYLMLFKTVVTALSISAFSIALNLRGLKFVNDAREVYTDVCYEPYQNSTGQDAIAFDTAYTDCKGGHFRYFSVEPPEDIQHWCLEVCKNLLSDSMLSYEWIYFLFISINMVSPLSWSIRPTFNALLKNSEESMSGLDESSVKSLIKFHSFVKQVREDGQLEQLMPNYDPGAQKFISPK